MAKQPHLLVDEGDVHDVALIPGNPDRVDRIASHCDESELVAENREYRIVNAVYEGVDLTVCSTGIGCPSAAIAIEELHNVGVDTVIRVGTCGGLQTDVEIGDMVVATGAAKEEGTSKRYESATYPAVPDYGTLTALVDAAEANDEQVHVGPIVSDDAFYNESDEYVADWEEAGLLAIEMEAAAVFSLARRRGMDAGAICTADGNLVAGTQKGADSDEEPRRRRTTSAAPSTSRSTPSRRCSAPTDPGCAATTRPTTATTRPTTATTRTPRPPGSPIGSRRRPRAAPAGSVGSSDGRWSRSAGGWRTRRTCSTSPSWWSCRRSSASSRSCRTR